MLNNLCGIKATPTQSVLVIKSSDSNKQVNYCSQSDIRTAKIANKLIDSFSNLRQNHIYVRTQSGNMSNTTSLKPVPLEDPNLAKALSKTTINLHDVEIVIAIDSLNKSNVHTKNPDIGSYHEARLSDLKASLREELSAQNQLLNVVTITKQAKIMRGQKKQTLWVIFNKAKPQEPLDRKESPSVDYFLGLPKKNETTA